MFLSRLGLGMRATQLPRRTLAPSALRLLSTEHRSIIEKAIKEKPVVVFMKGTPDQPRCGFSRAVMQVLDQYNMSPINLKTYDVLNDPVLREGIKEFNSWPTIPQVFVDGEFVGGADIMVKMFNEGDLDSVLLDAKAVTENDLPPPPEK